MYKYTLYLNYCTRVYKWTRRLVSILFTFLTNFSMEMYRLNVVLNTVLYWEQVWERGDCSSVICKLRVFSKYRALPSYYAPCLYNSGNGLKVTESFGWYLLSAFSQICQFLSFAEIALKMLLKHRTTVWTRKLYQYKVPENKQRKNGMKSY